MASPAAVARAAASAMKSALLSIPATVAPRSGGRREPQRLEPEAAADVEQAPPRRHSAALAAERLQLLQPRDGVERLERRDVTLDVPRAVHVDELPEREVVHARP